MSNQVPAPSSQPAAPSSQLAAPGTIPSSDALAEADARSFDELFSRDPLKLTQADIGKLVLALREQRVRWQAAEAAGAAKGAPKKVASRAASLITTASADDLGL